MATENQLTSNPMQGLPGRLPLLSPAMALGALRLVRFMGRREGFWNGVLLVGAGAVAGAVGGILLAPASGRETRRRLRREADRLGVAARRRVDRLLATDATAPPLRPSEIRSLTGTAPDAER